MASTEAEKDLAVGYDDHDSGRRGFKIFRKAGSRIFSGW